MGHDRPMDVFDAAKKLFIHQYQLSVHQRLSQAFAMGGIQADEKPSQWMARCRHTGGEWDRDDVEHWALFRQLPTAPRTALEVPTPQLTIDELLNKADDLFTTLPRDMVASEDTNITAAVLAGTRPKRRVVNNESDKHIHVNPPSFVRSLRHFGIAENLRPGDENLRHLTVTSIFKKMCIFLAINSENST